MELLALTGPFAGTTQVQELASTYGLDMQSARISTNSRRLGDADIAPSSFDTVVSVGEPGAHDFAYLGTLARLLSPGGRLTVVESGVSGLTLGKSLTLAGLTLSEARAGVVVAAKPAWETGVALAIKAHPAVAAPAPAPPAAAWKLTGLDDDMDDLVDEDALLTESDLIRPDPSACAKPKAKPCQNCTCGRAEEENAAPVKLTQEMLDNPTSGCGSVRWCRGWAAHCLLGAGSFFEGG